MEFSERYRIKLDPIVSHGAEDDGPRMFNLHIKDRVSGASVNAYLVGSKTAVQTVVGRDEFFQFNRLTGGADDIIGLLVLEALRRRGILSITPYVSFVKDLRPLLPPPPI
jgi:hypothetical protein